MSRVQTVLGSIRSEQLGFCQSHEHLCVEPGYHTVIQPHTRIDDPSSTLKELLSYREAGGEAIVDAQPARCGRNARVLEYLSRRSCVHILASTGFHRTCLYPKDHWIFSASQNDLMSLFVHELTSGMDIEFESSGQSNQTGLRAGLIKTAYDGCLDQPLIVKLFSAAAAAAVTTGAPLMVHIEKHNDPLRLATFLFDSGLEPVQIIFCHMDRMTEDFDIHLEICRMGIFLEYDTIGRFKYHSDWDEIALITGLVHAGFSQNLLLGLDVTRERLRSYGGTIGLTYILETFIPLMKNAGITQDLINQFFFRNPARAFSFLE